MKCVFESLVLRCSVRVGKTRLCEFTEQVATKVREGLLFLEGTGSVHERDGDEAGYNKEDRRAHQQGIVPEERLAEHERMVWNIHLN